MKEPSNGVTIEMESAVQGWQHPLKQTLTFAGQPQQRICNSCQQRAVHVQKGVCLWGPGGERFPLQGGNPKMGDWPHTARPAFPGTGPKERQVSSPCDGGGKGITVW